MQRTSLNDITHLMNIPFEGNQIITGVSVDSRKTAPGNLFFALPGLVVDGHSYIQKAVSNGATALVVKKNYSGPSYGVPIIFSDDVLASLQLLACQMIKRSSIKIVAVTGSLGKTTVKDFITSLLKHKFTVSASPGNSNSQIGLALSIINHIDLNADYAILEMGMTHSGQIEKLVQMAPPTIAVVTSVALVHACNFDSINEIAESKAEIFSSPLTTLGIYPKDCSFTDLFASCGTFPKLTFSTNLSTADYFLEAEADKMTIYLQKESVSTSPPLGLPGKHNEHNFLIAAVVARHLGMSWKEIGDAQSTLKLPERRLERVEKNGVVFINDSYNASEDSMKSALSSLPTPKGTGKKIAVIGEMLELGKFSRMCHLSVAKHALTCVDTMFCLGQECAPIDECWREASRQVYWTQQRSDLIDLLRSSLNPNDVVLLKGSRANELWKLLEELEQNLVELTRSIS